MPINSQNFVQLFYSHYVFNIGQKKSYLENLSVLKHFIDKYMKPNQLFLDRTQKTNAVSDWTNQGLDFDKIQREKFLYMKTDAVLV